MIQERLNLQIKGKHLLGIDENDERFNSNEVENYPNRHTADLLCIPDEFPGQVW